MKAKAKWFTPGKVSSQGSIFDQMRKPRPEQKPVHKLELKLHVKTCQTANGR